MGDQPIDSGTDSPVGASKSESPTYGVTAVASSAPNEARAPLTPTEEEGSSREDTVERSSSEKTPGQIIREIRKDLDELWEAQRESIIAAIKIEKLDHAYEHTRKQRQQI